MVKLSKLDISLVAIFLFEITLIIDCFGNGLSGQPICPESEQRALLGLKRDLVDPSKYLSSWTIGTDCCEWERVVCDNATGHVSKLLLNGGSFGGRINASLLGLEHLTFLDLRSNDFAGAPIPSFIGSLPSLRHLNLEDSGFEGEIPPQLGNLSRLVSLHVEDGYGLSSRNIMWLSGLSSLKFLHISYVDLNKASYHWLKAINKLSSLTELRLTSCELDRMESLPYVNFTSLKVLDLSLNRYYSVLPVWIFTLSKLVSLTLNDCEFFGPFPNSSWSLNALTNLDVSDNSLNSTIPNNIYSLTMLESLNFDQNKLQGAVSSSIINLSSLTSFSLSGNRLEGIIPTSIGHLCDLKLLDFGSNVLSGDISETLQGLLSGGCLQNSLRSLYLYGNLFTGKIRDYIGELKHLEYLSLSRNNISGPIPGSLGKLSLLKILDLSGNKLNGTLPRSIGSLSNLNVLDISGNLLEGTLTENNFFNFSSLTDLRASGNSFSLRVSQRWNPPSHLSNVQLESWKLGPKFPAWVRYLKGFLVIDISNTGISDSIPNWFWNMSSLEFFQVNLSNNQIYGEISSKQSNGPITTNLNCRSSIYLNSNNLTGPLPQISSHVRLLDLSNNFFSGDISRLICKPKTEDNSLTILRLKDNLLSGKMSDCWSHWISLEMINLGNNNLSGEIPSSIGMLQSLQSLHLRNNSLSGDIPHSLQNCSMIKVIDLGLNKINGTIPIVIGKYLLDLAVLSLRSNRLIGKIPRELCGLSKLQILDVANNALSGKIPSCIGSLSAMVIKPQSMEPIFANPFSFSEYLEDAFVTTKGREDQYGTILTLLASLDLSQNRFSGEIPQQLTMLQGLMSLNLSRNVLRGNIPAKIGDMTWIQSLDLSINKLEGRIPPSVAELHFLSHFDVSFNNLSGRIPQSTQVKSIEVSSFSGNRFLCGPPLLKKCAEDVVTPLPSPFDRETGEHDYEHWFRLGLGMGFGVGFAGVIAPLLLFRFWRRAYFWFFEEYVWYKIVDCVIKYKRLIRAA